jgi:hypothetical protein
MSCPRCNAPTLLSWVPRCPISVFLSQLTCPSVIFLPSCPLFLFLSVPSRHSQAVLSWLSCQAFLSQLSCPSILVPSSFSPLSCICCHAFIVLSYLSCPTCPVLGALCSKSYTDCPVLNVLSWLSCPECLVLAVQGRPNMADQNVKKEPKEPKGGEREGKVGNGNGWEMEEKWKGKGRGK